MRSTRFFIIIFLLGVSNIGTATPKPKVYDYLIYNEDTFLVYLPEFIHFIQDRISKKEFQNCDDYIKKHYRATWLIENNELYLIALSNACYGVDKDKKFDLNRLFPIRCKNGRVKIKRPPQFIFAQSIPYIRILFFDVISEKEIWFNFHKGKIENVRMYNNYIDNLKFQDRKNTNETRNMIRDTILSTIKYTGKKEMPKNFSIQLEIWIDSDGKKTKVTAKNGENINLAKIAQKIRALAPWDIIMYRNNPHDDFFVFNFSYNNNQKCFISD